MKAKGLHEGCVEQIVRLYRDRLYTPETAQNPLTVITDSEGRIRIDDWEMRRDVQQETRAQMAKVTEENIFETTDLAGFKQDFMEIHGFNVEGVDYEADVDTLLCDELGFQSEETLDGKIAIGA
jgi:enoyl-[acyl-carrier protein] reductase/trans-2-enoyl-CoA reductase (NAD+)